tara:strand:+ start:344 stop:631 length:288 start_codon:yes stop_codon:yes gene_type:complete
MMKGFAATRFSWESDELYELRTIKRLVIQIKYDKDDAKIDHLLDTISDEEQRLIDRDSDVNSKKVCSHCQNEEIFVCEPCMVAWSDEIKPVVING